MITIKITGPQGSGKSNAARTIQRELKKANGWISTILDEGDDSIPSAIEPQVLIIVAQE